MVPGGHKSPWLLDKRWVQSLQVLQKPVLEKLSIFCNRCKGYKIYSLADKRYRHKRCGYTLKRWGLDTNHHREIKISFKY